MMHFKNAGTAGPEFSTMEVTMAANPTTTPDGSKESVRVVIRERGAPYPLGIILSEDQASALAEALRGKRHPPSTSLFEGSI